MPSAEHLVPFFVASLIFAFVPGPGMFYAAAQTLAAGRAAGWWSALGFHIAGLGHIAAAAFGVSALLAVVPALFTALKLAGATYLIWLGVRYLSGSASLAPAATCPSALNRRRALRDSIAVEAINPKSALFYLAFLPPFADPSATLPIWLQIVVLGMIVNVMFSVTDAILIETSHGMARRLRSSQRYILAARRAGGGMLIFMGLNLALARNA